MVRRSGRDGWPVESWHVYLLWNLSFWGGRGMDGGFVGLVVGVSVVGVRQWRCVRQSGGGTETVWE